MPPVTPSPHRFLSGRKQPSPAKDDKKPSLTKPSRGDGFDGATLKAAPKASQFTARPSVSTKGDGFDLSTPNIKPTSSQFAQTPRFSTGRPAPSPRSVRTDSPARSGLAHALRASVQATEVVEDVPCQMSNDDDEMLDLEPEEALPSTEMKSDCEGWIQDLPHSPKRRRLDNMSTGFQAAFGSPARPDTFKHPTTPASALRSGPQQFTRGSSVARSVVGAESSVHRPAFMRSSLAPPEHSEPLPEAFSPHRRGEKFVPGGMAATLQQWIVETGQAGAHGRRGQGYYTGEAYVHRLKVESMTGRGPISVLGKDGSDAQARLLLITDGKRTSSQISPGSIIGVRAPCWKVDVVEGCNWIVAVDWRILT